MFSCVEPTENIFTSEIFFLHVKVKQISHQNNFFLSVSHMEFYFPCVKRSKNGKNVFIFFLTSDFHMKT